MQSTALRLEFNVHGTLRRAAEACEAEVFLNWFGNTRQQLAEEYAAYEDDSVFVGVFDQYDTAVGAMRLIRPTHGRLKTTDDLAQEPWNVDGARSLRAAGFDLATTWDVATVGVRAGRQGPNLMVAAALYHAIFMAYRANGFRSLVAILDEHVRALLTGIGLPFHVLPGARTTAYLGSPASTPVYAGCANLVDGQRRVNPDGYRLVMEGIGLDGIGLPGLEAYAIDADLRADVVRLGGDVPLVGGNAAA